MGKCAGSNSPIHEHGQHGVTAAMLFEVPGMLLEVLRGPPGKVVGLFWSEARLIFRQNMFLAVLPVSFEVLESACKPHGQWLCGAPSLNCHCRTHPVKQRALFLADNQGRKPGVWLPAAPLTTSQGLLQRLRTGHPGWAVCIPKDFPCRSQLHQGQAIRANGLRPKPSRREKPFSAKA